MPIYELPTGRLAVMGILNVTPDSFSDGGRYGSVPEAFDAALQMIAEGADLIDVGGESTRPGAEPVPIDEEIHRVMPVVERLVQAGVPVSLDTSKPEVARQGIDAGIHVLNDVTGLRSAAMREVLSGAECSVCVMHMNGDPRTMQVAPSYAYGVVPEVLNYLEERCEVAVHDGIASHRLWIDPGIGFGKSVEDNLALLRDLRLFVETGYPVLLGVSRKSFIGRILGGFEPLPVTERLEGTLALHAWAAMQNVRVLRVHDVLATARLLRMLEAIIGDGIASDENLA